MSELKELIEKEKQRDIFETPPPLHFVPNTSPHPQKNFPKSCNPAIPTE